MGLVNLSLPPYSPQLPALARSEQAQARLSVAAQAADAWYQLALLPARVRIGQSTLRSVDTLFRGAQQKYPIGAAAVLDLAQTRLLRHSAQSGLQQGHVRGRTDDRRAGAHPSPVANTQAEQRI
jgi:hypothetical protein